MIDHGASGFDQPAIDARNLCYSLGDDQKFANVNAVRWVATFMSGTKFVPTGRKLPGSRAPIVLEDRLMQRVRGAIDCEMSSVHAVRNIELHRYVSSQCYIERY